MLVNMKMEIFTDVKDFPIHLQYGFHNADDCYVHGHADFSELVVVLDGTAVHIAGEERYPISKGDVFVVSRYMPHGFAEAENLKICNIMFHPEQVLENIYNLRELVGYQALFVVEPQQLQSRLKLRKHDFDITEAYISGMMEEYRSRRDGWQAMVYSEFLRLCTHLSRCCESSTASANGAMKLAKAVAYIEKHYNEEISMEKLSGVAGYSERQLGRLFGETFSESPLEYITRLRMRKAVNLLRTTSESIGEIAWQCGFPDQNYFSRVFKKYTGQTPSSCRKMR